MFCCTKVRLKKSYTCRSKLSGRTFTKTEFSESQEWTVSLQVQLDFPIKSLIFRGLELGASVTLVFVSILKGGVNGFNMKLEEINCKKLVLRETTTALLCTFYKRELSRLSTVSTYFLKSKVRAYSSLRVGGRLVYTNNKSICYSLPLCTTSNVRGCGATRE